MSDKMREDFEDFASDQYEWPQAIQRNADGEYKLIATAEAWRYWQASRAALVVELPHIGDYLDTYRQGTNREEYLDALCTAIQSAGVSVK